MDAARLQLRIRRTLRITLAWVVVGLVSALFEDNVLARHGVPGDLKRLLDQHFWRFALAGLVGGGVYIFLLRDRLRRLNFIKAFGLMAVLVVLVVTAVNAFLPELLTGEDASVAFNDRVMSLHFAGQCVFWVLLVGSTMLMVRINDQQGGRGGIDHLLGRYDKPRTELRVFMFLDMRSSTSIAEQLGHVKYFALLNRVYADITDPIIDSGGEIYQYVGDEISVSWPLRRGIRKQRALRCFFRIRRKLKERSPDYQARWGIAPIFKAGFHYGPVTMGQVGLVKKELIFSGDVVNTAARIQNSCNAYGVDNLISKELLDLMRPPAERFERREIGEIELKGKRQAVGLWTVEPRNGQ